MQTSNNNEQNNNKKTTNQKIYYTNRMIQHHKPCRNCWQRRVSQAVSQSPTTSGVATGVASHGVPLENCCFKNTQINTTQYNQTNIQLIQ